eukprot:g3673.t1
MEGRLKTELGKLKVKCVEGINANLGSVSEVAKLSKQALLFNDEGVYMYDGPIDNTRKVGSLCENGLYSIDESFLKTKEKALRTSWKYNNKARHTHLRLGCLSKSGLIRAKRYNALNGLDYTNEEIEALDEIPCIGCGAAHRSMSKTSKTRGKNQPSNYRKLDTRHLRGYHDNEWAVDLYGPIPDDNHKSYKYVVYFLRLKTNYARGYPVIGKGKFPAVLETFLTEHDQQYNVKNNMKLTVLNGHFTFEGKVSKNKVKLIRVDNAMELNSEECRKIYKKHVTQSSLTKQTD